MELPSKRIGAQTTNHDDILKYARVTQQPKPMPKNKAINPRILEARSAFTSSLLYSVGLLALGGIVTGITYSMASSGGTYTVTTGLFLIGGIYFCVAIWNMLKWLVLLAANK